MIKASEFEKKWGALKDKHLFLACSGGVDSMVLLSLLTTAKFKVSVLHINYQLRGEDSMQDEQLVSSVCQQYNIPFQVKRYDTNALLLQNGGNLQDTARKLRYDWFKEILSATANNYIALGHHRDDQVETFFQHIARKSGIMGMAGMLETHTGIIRPLLTYDKAEIYQFAKDNQLEWREDISNQKSDYSRNKLRNILLPELEKSIPTIRQSVLTMVKAFQETQADIENKVAKTIRTITDNHYWKLEDFDHSSAEEIAEILRASGIRATFIKELKKLRNAQKGKQSVIDDYIISREKDGFSFIKHAENRNYQLIITKVDALPAIFSTDELYLDAGKIIGELKLRPWKTGDKITPIGMKGSKLISKILTEANISTAMKRQALILTDDKNIHWCVGFKVSKIACAQNSSDQILKINVQY